MLKNGNHHGYKVIIVPEDGRESTTFSMSLLKFRLILLSIASLFLIAAASVFFWGTYVYSFQELNRLHSEFDELNERASRVVLIEKNLVEMDKYIRYIRLAMSLTGKEHPPALEDFVTNDSLKKSYELSADGASFANMPNISPVSGGWVSRGFSVKDDHLGVDYAASEGKVIRATARGLVTDIAIDEQLGNIVTIDHRNGYLSQFAHCKEIIAQKGSTVERGETIATVGSSGKSSSAPHLHYAIKKNGEYVNPLDFIVTRGIRRSHGK